MKQIFIAFFFLPLLAGAQNCQLKKEKDKFSQEPRLSTGFMPLNAGTDRALLSIDADSREINLLFSLSNPADPRCFDDASTATVSFEGKASKLILRNSGSMNCEGIFQATFRNGTTVPSALQRITTQKVATIALTGNNGKVITITLTDEQKQLLNQMGSCLVTEAKTLLPKQ